MLLNSCPVSYPKYLIVRGAVVTFQRSGYLSQVVRKATNPGKAQGRKLSAIPSIVGVANAATTFSGLGQFTNRRSRVNQVLFGGRRCLRELDFGDVVPIVDNLSKTDDMPQLLAGPKFRSWGPSRAL